MVAGHPSLSLSLQFLEITKALDSAESDFLLGRGYYFKNKIQFATLIEETSQIIEESSHVTSDHAEWKQKATQLQKFVAKYPFSPSTPSYKSFNEALTNVKKTAHTSHLSIQDNKNISYLAPLGVDWFSESFLKNNKQAYTVLKLFDHLTRNVQNLEEAQELQKLGRELKILNDTPININSHHIKLYRNRFSNFSINQYKTTTSNEHFILYFKTIKQINVGPSKLSQLCTSLTACFQNCLISCCNATINCCSCEWVDDCQPTPRRPRDPDPVLLENAMRRASETTALIGRNQHNLNTHHGGVSLDFSSVNTYECAKDCAHNCCTCWFYLCCCIPILIRKCTR